MRAAYEYAGKSVSDQVDGLPAPATMARIVAKKKPRGVKSRDELWRIADGLGVPRSFLERGFAADPEEVRLSERVEALEHHRETVWDYLAELADLLGQVAPAVGTLPQVRTLRALRDTDHRTEHQQGAGQ